VHDGDGVPEERSVREDIDLAEMMRSHRVTIAMAQRSSGMQIAVVPRAVSV
jgi:hypothetical protein